MKYHGCILEFTAHRNKELMRAFREALASCERIDISEVSSRVVNMPCARFWVSEERAAVVISAMFQGKDILSKMRPTKREMFLEIFHRVKALRSIYPHLPLFDLVTQVVNSPAPKFYMLPRCAMEIIYKIKKGHYKRLEN